MKKIFLFILVLGGISPALANTFTNSYISFKLPPNWSCRVAGTEWVCRSSNADQARQAIIVLTAKEMGPNDNFAYYNQYLKTPKTPKHRDGTVATQSKVLKMNTVNIGGHPWTDALHLGSLLPNFYTRYLVTVKNKIAILITFNAKKEFYTQYSKDFFDAISSLKVTATAASKHSNIRGPDEPIGADTPPIEEDWATAATTPNNSKKGSNIWLYGLALILAGAGIFFLLKKKKK